jgi:hypothetical protein
MPWTVRTAAYWADLSRAGIDAALGYSVDYDGTLEGDWTATIGAVAFDSDQGMQIALDERSPLTATGSALDAAVAPVVYRKAAVSSRYTVTAVSAGSVAAEAIYRDTNSRSWRVVTGFGVVGVGDELVVEAVDTGPLALSQSAPTTLSPVTASTAPTSLLYTPGDAFQIGRDVEADSLLRRRWTVSLGRPLCPTPAGIRRTLLALTWVTAVSATRTSPGTLAIRVAPTPVGADQELELAEAIYACVGASALTTGGDSTVVTGVDGFPATVYWTGATTQTVDVAITLVLATGVTLASVSAAVEQAALAQFDLLNTGSTLYQLAIVQALPGPSSGVIRGTLLLDGVNADVTPATSTALLVPGTVTVA